MDEFVQTETLKLWRLPVLMKTKQRGVEVLTKLDWLALFCATAFALAVIAFFAW